MPLQSVPSRRRGLIVTAFAALLAVGGAASLPVAAELSAVDREAIEAAFARGDSNGDGRLSRDEAERFPEIAARFDELDSDHDGFLSLAEFAVGAAPPTKP